MIYECLNVITDNLNSYIKKKFGLNKNKVKLSNVISRDDNSDTNELDKITVTLVNIEQEKVLSANNSKGNAPIHINLYVLFAAYFGEDGSYAQALRELSEIIAYFAGQRVFSGQNTPDLPGGVEKLVFDLEKTSNQDLQNVWMMLNGKFTPSVLYKARMITIGDSGSPLGGIIGI